MAQRELPFLKDAWQIDVVFFGRTYIVNGQNSQEVKLELGRLAKMAGTVEAWKAAGECCRKIQIAEYGITVPYGGGNVTSEFSFRVRLAKFDLDLDNIHRIDSRSFSDPISRGQLLTNLSASGSATFVAESHGEMVGYVHCVTQRNGWHINNIAIDGAYRRLGVGTSLVEFLKSILPRKHGILTATVGEHNLPAQQFFRANGLLCLETLRGHYQDRDCDAYYFVFERREKL